ncbi:MAG TPA: RNA methyltransferase [Candidatus Babeliales bacterium]|nr:RNA methyltransferase [Candidatus Babeliales bacterium]
MPGALDDIAYLSSLVSENKRTLIEKALEYRTRYLTVAIENTTNPHNASAIVRSCDIFGVQDMHIIQSSDAFRALNTVAKGASKWVDLYPHKTTASCISQLKQQGYRIVATTPHERGYTLSELPVTQKTALLFGTEITGLSDEAIALADDFVTIPMFGFTESFNISVSAAICLYDFITRLHASDSVWQLTAAEKETLQREWLQRVLHIKK